MDYCESFFGDICIARRTTVKEIIDKAPEGKSGAVILEAHDGREYIAKYLVNLQAPTVVINEFVGAALAHAVGLPCRSPALLVISDETIDDADWLLSRLYPAKQLAGVMFGSHAYADYQKIAGQGGNVRRSRNYDAVAGIALFDVWLGNIDRNNGNALLWGRDADWRYEIAMIDHGLFFGGFTWTVGSLNTNRQLTVVKQPNEFQQRPWDCSDFERYARSIAALSDDLITAILTTIPQEWNLRQADERALFLFIRDRRDKLWRLIAKQCGW